MTDGIRNIFSGFGFHRVSPGDPRRIFRTLVFHIRPRMVAEKTLRFTLTFGLGGTAAVLVGLQLFTGILLKFAYEPLPAHAYESVIRLQAALPFGQFVRNIHFWGANLLVGVMSLHGLRVFFTHAYRPPRRVNWMVGLSLFALVLAANLTGYLLPYDQLAYWATTICIGMLEYIPVFGARLQRWAMGGPAIGPSTLRNFFAFHTAVLPSLTVILMSYHFWRIRKAGGLVVPRRPGESAEEKPVMVPSNPSLLLREAAVGLAALAVILTAALIFDAPLGAPANPGLSPNPTKAPWYFAGIQEMLVHFHPTAALLIVLVLALGAVFILPFAGQGEDHAGVWFASTVGRRTAVAGAAAAALITPSAVILAEYAVDPGRWMAGWPGIAAAGVIPALLFMAVPAGMYAAVRKVFRGSRTEALQAVAALLATMFVILTLVCAFFRIEGMKLGWVFR